MHSSLQNQWDKINDKASSLWQKSLAPRYNALNASEQRLVRVAAIVLPLIIFVFGIVLPVFDKNTALHKELVSISQQAQEANALADRLLTQPKQHGITNNNILSQVDNIARQTGVRTFMTRLRPQQVPGGSQQLQTQIKGVPYLKVTGFIAALEKAGLSLTQVKMQATTPGHIHMQATIGR